MSLLDIATRIGGRYMGPIAPVFGQYKTPCLRLSGGLFRHDEGQFDLQRNGLNPPSINSVLRLAQTPHLFLHRN